MKKHLTPLILAVLLSTTMFAQESEKIIRPNMPSPFKYVPGWVNVTDFTYGFGLGDTNDPNNPCDKSFFSFTSGMSYQINRNFTTGGGTGLMFNNERFFVPLYMNGRYNFSMPGGRVVPYLDANAGVLLNFKDFSSETRFFVNPSAGMRYVFTTYVSATGAVGLLTHAGPQSHRNSFLTLRLGIFIALNKQ